MRKYPIHVTWAQRKTPNTICITWGSKWINYDKEFTTVTTHKNVQNYYNEKWYNYATPEFAICTKSMKLFKFYSKEKTFFASSSCYLLRPDG